MLSGAEGEKPDNGLHNERRKLDQRDRPVPTPEPTSSLRAVVPSH